VTPTYAEFLLAQIFEDEAAAAAATPGPWHALDGGVCALDNETGDLSRWPVDSTSDVADDRADRVHIARHDPARVLADCAAKRAIVRHLADTVTKCLLNDWPDDGGMEVALYADHARYLLRMMVQPYAAHPDFPEEWRDLTHSD
jgi:hypothetical protein